MRGGGGGGGGGKRKGDEEARRPSHLVYSVTEQMKTTNTSYLKSVTSMELPMFVPV